MSRKLTLVLFAIFGMSLSVFAQKALMHYISVPVIEGCGVYSSVRCLVDGNSGTSTTAASITSLALMGTNSTLGIVKFFASEDTKPNLRKIHRVVGITVSAAAVWLAISASVDKVNIQTRVVSYAYTGLTVVPIVVFSF
jgi:hypothetical protein